jgi:hypothetical protein
MIYNLSTILRETMKQTNKNKEKEEVRQIPESFLENKPKPKFPYNLKIDVELANRKSMELYKKYNTNTIPKFSILDLDKDLDSNKDLHSNKDLDPNKAALVEQKPNKSVLTICSICVFAFLAYSYFKKR